MSSFSLPSIFHDRHGCKNRARLPRVASRLVSEKSRSSRGNVLDERINTTSSSPSLLSFSSFRTPLSKNHEANHLFSKLCANRNFLPLLLFEIDFWRSLFRRIHPWLPRRMARRIRFDGSRKSLRSFFFFDFPFPRRRDGLVGEDEKCYGYDFE